MLRNYLITAYRSFQRQRGYTAINVVGLAVGITCCVFILLFIREEMSYDGYLDHADRLYRIVRTEGGAIQSVFTNAPLAPVIASEVPEAAEAVRADYASDVLFKFGDRSFNEDVLLAEPGYLAAFRNGSLHPDVHALDAPDAVVLTQSLADRLLGQDVDPVGKVVTVAAYGTELNVHVTGVVDDVPANAHLHYGAIMPFSIVAAQSNRMENWRTNWLLTYVLLKPGADRAQAQAHVDKAVKRRVPNFSQSFTLQPITQVHLHPAPNDLEPQGNVAYVYIFAAIALFVLLIACINFMNLSTARASQRAREVGMRKALGAQRRQLVGQFMGEAVGMSLAAGLLVLVLLRVFLPLFNQLAGKAIAIDYTGGYVVPLVLGMVVVVGLLAGIYPALFLARYRPSEVLMGSGASGGAGAVLRKSLVVVQFAVSIFLIAATLVVQHQLAFVQNTDLGFKKDHLMVLPLEGTPGDEGLDVVRRELEGTSGVTAVAFTGDVPGNDVSDLLFEPEGMTSGDNLPDWNVYFVGDRFLDMMGIDVVSGRSFSPDHPADREGFILNEAAVARARALAGDAWANPIGRTLSMYLPGANGWEVARTGPVIGVVEDFHYQSLHQRTEPLVIQVRPQSLDYALVRVAGTDVGAAVTAVQRTWERVAPDQPFEFSFLDARFDALYRSETRMARIFRVFSVLAILVACLGLFGLVSFTADRRAREIGIRKVLGATVPGIVARVSGDTMKLVALAVVLALPLVYLIMNRWLDNFAYSAGVGVAPFVVAGLGAVIIAWLTVSYHAIRLARVDPAATLRYE